MADRETRRGRDREELAKHVFMCVRFDLFDVIAAVASRIRPTVCVLAGPAIFRVHYEVGQWDYRVFKP